MRQTPSSHLFLLLSLSYSFFFPTPFSFPCSALSFIGLLFPLMDPSLFFFLLLVLIPSLPPSPWCLTPLICPLLAECLPSSHLSISSILTSHKALLALAFSSEFHST